MKDGAQPVELPVQCLVRSTFGEDRIISRYFNHVWPRRSPYLTPYDFWLKRFLKSTGYREQLSLLAALKYSMCQNISAITQEMLLTSVNGVVTRLTAVLLNDALNV